MLARLDRHSQPSGLRALSCLSNARRLAGWPGGVAIVRWRGRLSTSTLRFVAPAPKLQDISTTFTAHEKSG